MRTTDCRIVELRFDTEDYLYRTPIKFGGVALDRATILNVHATIEAGGGVVSRGFGSMPLGNVWSFPSRRLSYDQTLAVMLALTDGIAARLAVGGFTGHPIEIAHAFEPELVALCQAQDVGEPVPPLCAFVAASAFDAAVHDAYGKAFGLNCYRTYGPDFLRPDLGHFLGPEFAGLRLDAFISADPVPSLPLYHLVGALDPLTPADVTKPVGDGRPEHLADWLTADGLTHLKIKLNGDDLAWDAARVLGVERVAGGQAQHYSLDFNERCPNADYLIRVLERVRADSPAALGRIQYVEQPTARDLWAWPENPMHAASAVKPVVIDESLLGLESLRRARELGYTGAALKACKGQSQSLLMAAAARHYRMFLCVQDLTCPGASLIHSVGLAAHVPGVAAIESNARQYLPAANEPWAERFPGIFRITDGTVRTSEINGPGLGAL